MEYLFQHHLAKCLGLDLRRRWYGIACSRLSKCILCKVVLGGLLRDNVVNAAMADLGQYILCSLGMHVS